MNEAAFTYMVQTQPSPNEGPHAQEVSQADFRAEARAHPHAEIDFDGKSNAFYLRLDLLRTVV